MSIKAVIQLLSGRLPADLLEEVSKAPQHGEGIDITVPGLSLWRVRNEENLRRIMTRRLATTLPEGKQWVQEAIALLDERRCRSGGESLWQAYGSSAGRSYTYLIDTTERRVVGFEGSEGIDERP